KWGYTYTGGWRLDAAEHEVKDLGAATLRRQAAESLALLGGSLRLYQIHSATLESGVLDDPQVRRGPERPRASGVGVGPAGRGPRAGRGARRDRDRRRARAALGRRGAERRGQRRDAREQPVGARGAMGRGARAAARPARRGPGLLLVPPVRPSLDLTLSARGSP